MLVGNQSEWVLADRQALTIRSMRCIPFHSLFQSLRLRILRVCLHVITIVIIIPYSEWTAAAARGKPPTRTQPWPAVLFYATRIVRNLSSADTRARQELRNEKDLVDCLVWITRVGVESKDFDNEVSWMEGRF